MEYQRRTAALDTSDDGGHGVAGGSVQMAGYFLGLQGAELIRNAPVRHPSRRPWSCKGESTGADNIQRSSCIDHEAHKISEDGLDGLRVYSPGLLSHSLPDASFLVASGITLVCVV